DIKQATIQQLLTGQTHLPGFTDVWQVTKLQHVANVLKGSGLSKNKLTPSGRVPCILYGELFTTYQYAISRVRNCFESYPSGLDASGLCFANRRSSRWLMAA